MTKIGNNSKIGEREREREEESLEFTVMWPMKVGCYNERDRKKEREQKGCASTGSESWIERKRKCERERKNDL